MLINSEKIEDHFHSFKLFKDVPFIPIPVFSMGYREILIADTYSHIKEYILFDENDAIHIYSEDWVLMASIDKENRIYDGLVKDHHIDTVDELRTEETQLLLKLAGIEITLFREQLK